MLLNINLKSGLWRGETKKRRKKEFRKDPLRLNEEFQALHGSDELRPT